jgi:hypothetical protein
MHDKEVLIHAFIILALVGSVGSNLHPGYFILWKIISEPIGDWPRERAENANQALALPPDFLEKQNGNRGKNL